MGAFAYCLRLSAHVHPAVYAEFLPGDKAAQGRKQVEDGVAVGTSSDQPPESMTLITLTMPPAPLRFMGGASVRRRRGR